MVIHADEVRSKADLVVLAGLLAPTEQVSGYFEVQKRSYLPIRFLKLISTYYPELTPSRMINTLVLIRTRCICDNKVAGRTRIPWAWSLSSWASWPARQRHVERLDRIIPANIDYVSVPRHSLHITLHILSLLYRRVYKEWLLVDWFKLTFAWPDNARSTLSHRISSTPQLTEL